MAGVLVRMSGFVVEYVLNMSEEDKHRREGRVITQSQSWCHCWEVSVRGGWISVISGADRQGLFMSGGTHYIQCEKNKWWNEWSVELGTNTIFISWFIFLPLSVEYEREQALVWTVFIKPTIKKKKQTDGYSWLNYNNSLTGRAGSGPAILFIQHVPVLCVYTVGLRRLRLSARLKIDLKQVRFDHWSWIWREDRTHWGSRGLVLQPQSSQLYFQHEVVWAYF